MKVKIKVKSNIDTNKIKKRVQKTKIESVEKATAYVWKCIRSSVKQKAGRTKKVKRYIERVYVWKNGQHQELDLTGKKIVPSQYFQKISSNPKYKHVQWRQGGHRQNAGVVKNAPTDTSEFSVRKGSPPGSPPYSWKIDRTTFGGRNSTVPDYWLKQSILFDPKNGIVYSNPRYGKKVLYLPQMLEMGTKPSAYQKNYFAGYAVWYRTFKNKQTHIYFTERWRKRNVKPASGGKRPYMSYGLKQAVQSGKLADIFAKTAKVQFR